MHMARAMRGGANAAIREKKGSPWPFFISAVAVAAV